MSDVKRFDPAGIGKGHLVVFASDYDAVDSAATALGVHVQYCEARIRESESQLATAATRIAALEAALEIVRAEYLRGFWNDDTLLRISAALLGSASSDGAEQ